MVHPIINEYIYNLTMRWIKDCYGYDCCNSFKSYIIIYYTKKRFKKKENKNKVVHSIIYVALLKKKKEKKTFSEVT